VHKSHCIAFLREDFSVMETTFNDLLNFVIRFSSRYQRQVRNIAVITQVCMRHGLVGTRDPSFNPITVRLHTFADAGDSDAFVGKSSVPRSNPSLYVI
jgi:hypothetical protein